MRFYEVWDQRSGNLLGSYGAEWEALAFIRELAAQGSTVNALELHWGDEDDDNLGDEIAAGSTLLERAQSAAPHATGGYGSGRSMMRPS